jgi:hypothetical protein
MTARLRLAVMATHREEELLAAARVLGGVARSLGIPPRRASEPEPVLAPVSAEAEAALPASDRTDAPVPARGVFDFEASEPARRAA